LAASLAAGVAGTRPNLRAIQCQNNLRRMTQAWTIYASDYADKVPNNFDIPGTENAINSGRFDNWVNNVMTWGAGGAVDDRSNTNQDWVRKGLLGKYVDVDAYVCPEDRYLSPPQLRAGWTRRVRSISMNSVFGLFSTSPSDPTAFGKNWGDQTYRQYLKRGQVPKPAKTWLLVDEQPDSINEGYFLNATAAATWGDIPAAFHNGGAGFSFADGHAEIRKWLSLTSRYPVNYFYPTTRLFDPPGRVDFAWYLEHTGYVNAQTGVPAFNY